MVALTALNDVVVVQVRISNVKTGEGRKVGVNVARHASTSEVGLSAAVKRQFGDDWRFCFVPTGF